jgi:hypothetical protein
MLQHNNQCDGGGDGGFVLNGFCYSINAQNILQNKNQVHPRRTTHGNKHTKNKKETNKQKHTHTHTHTQTTFDETINQASKQTQTNK